HKKFREIFLVAERAPKNSRAEARAAHAQQHQMSKSRLTNFSSKTFKLVDALAHSACNVKPAERIPYNLLVRTFRFPERRIFSPDAFGEPFRTGAYERIFYNRLKTDNLTLPRRAAHMLHLLFFFEETSIQRKGKR